MAKSNKAKGKDTQCGHRMRKSGGHSGKPSETEGLSRQERSDMTRRMESHPRQID